MPAWRRVLCSLDGRAIDRRAVRSPPVLLGAALLSVVVWLFEAGSYTSMLRGLPIAAPAWAGTFALIVANLGIAIPSGPSNIGVFEAACGGALLALGVSKELALCYALCLHLLAFSTVVVLGLPLTWRLGLRLTDLSGAAPGPAGRPTG